jgi:hypothetical protein
MVMAAKLARLTHKIAIQLHLGGRWLYHLQFSLQVASPETFCYILALRTLSSQVYKFQLAIYYNGKWKDRDIFS